MTISQIKDKYNINRISLTQVVKELISSNKYFNRKMLGLLITYLIFRVGNNFVESFLTSTRFIWSYNAILFILSLVFTAYLIQTALDKSNKVFSRERLNRSIVLLLFIIKTTLAFLVYIVPLLIIVSIIISIIATILSFIFKFDITNDLTLIYSVLIALIVIAKSVKYGFSTYLVVTHNINGFNALRLSKILFDGNRKSSITILIITILLPGIALQGVMFLTDSIEINIIANGLVGAINFYTHFIIAIFLSRGINEPFLNCENSLL